MTTISWVVSDEYPPTDAVSIAAYLLLTHSLGIVSMVEGGVYLPHVFVSHIVSRSQMVTLRGTCDTPVSLRGCIYVYLFYLMLNFL